MHINCCIGLKVTAILPTGGVASERVCPAACAAGLDLETLTKGYPNLIFNITLRFFKPRWVGFEKEHQNTNLFYLAKFKVLSKFDKCKSKIKLWGPHYSLGVNNQLFGIKLICLARYFPYYRTIAKFIRIIHMNTDHWSELPPLQIKPLLIR